MRRLLNALAAVALLASLGASSALATPTLVAAPRKATVKVDLMEMMVMTSTARVPAGRVAFVVRNRGKLVHNLVVIPSKAPPKGLPMKGAGASEKGSVAKTPMLKAGASKTLALTLKKGRYLLICNVAGHYMAGMVRVLIVG